MLAKIVVTCLVSENRQIYELTKQSTYCLTILCLWSVLKSNKTNTSFEKSTKLCHGRPQFQASKNDKIPFLAFLPEEP